MVKQQKMISHWDRCTFVNAVNEHLNEGWHVVQDTIAIAISAYRGAEGRPSSEEAYVCVLEKEE